MTQPLPGGERAASAAPVPPANDGISTLIPYRNGAALASYYLGVFSLIPCIGFLLGVAAVIFGIIGLKTAARNPQAKGKVHAIVGISLGGIFGLVWLVAMLIPLIAMFFKR